MDKNKPFYKKHLIFNKISNFFSFLFKSIPNFIKNIWLFRKEIYHFKPNNWVFSMSMFRKGIELEYDYINKHSTEETDIKLKKLKMMKRVIEIMLTHEYDLFLDVAEKILGYDYKIEYFNEKNESNLTYNDKEKNTALVKKSTEIEDDLWVELLNILDGQDLSNVKTDDEWKRKFDGSGFKSWGEE